MSTENTRARAIALLREARGLVEQLVTRGEVEREALHNLDNAIIDILPDRPDVEPPRPRLRIVGG
jgi:hypothetical protein